MAKVTNCRRRQRLAGRAPVGAGNDVLALCQLTQALLQLAPPGRCPHCLPPLGDQPSMGRSSPGLARPWHAADRAWRTPGARTPRSHLPDPARENGKICPRSWSQAHQQPVLFLAISGIANPYRPFTGANVTGKHELVIERRSPGCRALSLGARDGHDVRASDTRPAQGRLLRAGSGRVRGLPPFRRAFVMTPNDLQACIISDRRLPDKVEAAASSEFMWVPAPFGFRSINHRRERFS